jgi:hypothetical protein
VSLLGLERNSLEYGGNGVGYEVRPVRPFWFFGKVDEDLGRPLEYRAGSGPWIVEANANQASIKLIRDKSVLATLDVLGPQMMFETLMSRECCKPGSWMCWFQGWLKWVLQYGAPPRLHMR